MTSTAVKRAESGENKPRSRAKRTAVAPPPPTIGQMLSVRETQLGFLGRLDVDLMSMLASHLLMSDAQTLASMLAYFPMSVRTSAILWSAFNVTTLLYMAPDEAVAWVHAVSSIIDDADWRAKMWNTIDSAINERAVTPPMCRLKNSDYIVQFVMRKMLLGDYDPSSDSKERQFSRNCADWLLCAMSGKSIKQVPHHSWTLCAALVVRCRGIDEIAKIPVHTSEMCNHTYVYRVAASVSAEKASAVLAHFHQMLHRFDEMALAAFMLGRDDDVIKIIGMRPSAGRVLSQHFAKMRDVGRFVKLYQHIPLETTTKLLISLELGDADDSEIFRLVDRDIGDIACYELSGIGTSKQLKLLARYADRISDANASQIWMFMINDITPATYEALSAIPIFQETRNLAQIMRRSWNAAMYPLLLRDGLAMTDDMLMSVVEQRMAKDGIRANERIQFILEHIELTPKLAIDLLTRMRPMFGDRWSELLPVQQEGLEYLLQRIQTHKFDTTEVADFCSETLQSMRGVYQTMFAIATAMKID